MANKLLDAPPPNRLMSIVNAIGEAARSAREKISPWQYLSPVDIASNLPGGGIPLAWEESGKGRDALKAGNYAEAAGHYGNMALNLVPEGSALAKLAIFAGPAAKTANLGKLAEAQKMAEAGHDAKDIMGNTGWFQGADGKWRFEIPDNASKFIGSDKAPSMPSRIELAGQYFEQQGVPATKFATGQFPELDSAAIAYADKNLAAARDAAATQPMRDVLDHPALFEAYPHLAETPTVRETLSNVGGSYRDGRITYGGGSIAQQNDPRSVLLHELQHAVQRAEGFETGGSLAGVASEFGPLVQKEADAIVRMFDYDPALKNRLFPQGTDSLKPSDWDEAARRVYQRLAGEVEARNVQKRADMDEWSRTWPWNSEDVPRSQQILRSGQAPVDHGDMAISPAVRDIGGLRSHLDASYPNVDHWVSENPNAVTVSKVVVPSDARGQGLGTQFMQDVIEYGDRVGKPVALTPDASFGGKKSKLEQWYRSLGFEPNKGRSRDFGISESMVRKPREAE